MPVASLLRPAILATLLYAAVAPQAAPLAYVPDEKSAGISVIEADSAAKLGDITAGLCLGAC